MSAPGVTYRLTFFDDETAHEAIEHNCTAEELAELISNTNATCKGELPWLKLARFGERHSTNGSLRYNANVVAITGIEADYDGEVVPIEEAAEKIDKSGVHALLYTSPSYTPERPRWRVLCPVSHELPPDDRDHLLARLNGVLGGIIASESWTLSQAYYFGSIDHNPAHRAEIVDGMVTIDRADELDEIAIRKSNGRGADDGETHEPGDPEADIADIVAALDAIPNDDLDWNAWNRVGMATWRAAGGSAEGLTAFDTWSRKSRKYDADETASRWEHFFTSPPSELGAGTLFYLAQMAVPGWTAPSRRRHRTAADESCEDEEAPHLSEEELSLQFAGEQRAAFRHVACWGWLIWGSVRWQNDTLMIFSRVRRFCRAVGMAVIAAAPPDDPKALGAARRISSAHTVAAIAQLARADRRLAMSPDEFDADIWFMNTTEEDNDGG